MWPSALAAAHPAEAQRRQLTLICVLAPQALEDRGIVELLLTSDNTDGLSKGMIPGGTFKGSVQAMPATHVGGSMSRAPATERCKVPIRDDTL